MLGQIWPRTSTADSAHRCLIDAVAFGDGDLRDAAAGVLGTNGADHVGCQLRVPIALLARVQVAARWTREFGATLRDRVPSVVQVCAHKQVGRIDALRSVATMTDTQSSRNVLSAGQFIRDAMGQLDPAVDAEVAVRAAVSLRRPVGRCAPEPAVRRTASFNFRPKSFSSIRRIHERIISRSWEH